MLHLDVFKNNHKKNFSLKKIKALHILYLYFNSLTRYLEVKWCALREFHSLHMHRALPQSSYTLGYEYVWHCQ